MHIILEGPDNAGKTSLANAIIEEAQKKGVRVTYHHPGGAPADFAAESSCVEQQLGWLLSMENVIVDRVTPISQRVYNPDAMLNRVRADQWLRMMALNPLVIYCRPSTDRLLRHEDFTWREGESEEHKQKIITNAHKFVEAYDHLMQHIKCLHYNFEDDVQRTMIVDRVVAAMGGDASSCAWLAQLVVGRAY